MDSGISLVSQDLSRSYDEWMWVFCHEVGEYNEPF